MLFNVTLLLFALAALFFVVPRIRAQASRPGRPDMLAEDEIQQVIDWVRLEQKKARSIWRASFAEHAALATFCMLGIYITFIFLDAAFAWYKGGIWLGVLFYFVVFVAVDTIQLAAVATSDTGAGGALTKSRPVLIWMLVGLGLVLNLYISQVGYGLFNNLIATTTGNQAAAARGKRKRAQEMRLRLDELNSQSLREPVIVKNELDALLLKEPAPRSACNDPSHYGRWSRLNCDRVRDLRNELAKSRTRNRLAIEVPKLEAALAKSGPAVTNIDPTADKISRLLSSMGIRVSLLDTSEVLGRIVMIIVSLLFPAILFWWSDRANEAARESIKINRERTDRALANIGFVQDEGDHIREAGPQDAGQMQAVSNALASGLAAVREEVAQKSGLDGLASDPSVQAIEAFLLENIPPDGISVQDAFQKWRELGNAHEFAWFVDRVKSAAIKNNKIINDGKQLRKSA